MNNLLKKITIISTLGLVALGISWKINQTIPNETPVYGFATDLFFSEYIEGTSNNKVIEIFNGTGNPVDLSTYSIKLYANGTTTATSTLILGSISLPDGGTYTIYQNSATAAFKPSINSLSSTTVTNYNGDDALELLKSGSVIDVFGIKGMDPGASWTENDGVATGITFGFKDSGVTGQTVDRTLVRLPNVSSPTTLSSITYKGTTYTNGAFNPSEWGVYATDVTKWLGWHSYSSFTSASYAQNFLQSTTDNVSSCSVSGLSWSTLVSDFNSMSSLEQSNLKNNPTSNSTITSMHTRYQYLTSYNSDLRTSENDFLDFWA